MNTNVTITLPKLTIDYLAREYGAVLTRGGLGAVYADGYRLARRLARATGNDVEDVLVAVAERYGDMGRAADDRPTATTTNRTSHPRPR